MDEVVEMMSAGWQLPGTGDAQCCACARYTAEKRGNALVSVVEL